MDNPEKMATRQKNKKHNTICVGHHYTQTNTDSVNKTSIFSGYQNDYKHIKAKPRTKAQLTGTSTTPEPRLATLEGQDKYLPVLYKWQSYQMRDIHCLMCCNGSWIN